MSGLRETCVQFRGSDRSSCLVEALKESWTREMFADVTIYCVSSYSSSTQWKSRILRANKSVLAAGSPVLRHYLQTSSPTDEENTVLILAEFKFTVIKQMLRYLYTGLLPAKIDLEFKAVLKCFQIPLTDVCSFCPTKSRENVTNKFVRVRVIPQAVNNVEKMSTTSLKKKQEPLKHKSRIIKEFTRSEILKFSRSKQLTEVIDANPMLKDSVTLPELLPDLPEIYPSGPEKFLTETNNIFDDSKGLEIAVQRMADLSKQLRPEGFAANKWRAPNLSSACEIGIYTSGNVTRQTSLRNQKNDVMPATQVKESPTTFPSELTRKTYGKNVRVKRRSRERNVLVNVRPHEVVGALVSRHGSKIHVTVKGHAVSEIETSSVFYDVGREREICSIVSGSRENEVVASSLASEEADERDMKSTFAEEKKRNEKLKSRLRILKSSVDEAKVLAKKLLTLNGENLREIGKDGLQTIRKTPVPKLACKICKKSLSESYMWTHMQIHTDPSYLCEQCGRVFNLRSGLQMHQKYQHGEVVHGNARRYACPTCDKKFRMSRSLKKHVATHGVQRCDLCEFKFHDRESLLLHSCSGNGGGSGGASGGGSGRGSTTNFPTLGKIFPPADLLDENR